MALPFQFAGVTAATGAQLDSNFTTAANLGMIPCTVSGTNTITMTPIAGITPTLSVLANYMIFSGIVANTNSGAVTIQVAGLAVLNAYKDTVAGPVVLTGGELVAGCAFSVSYDSALNTGAGGFHIVYNTSIASGTIAGSVIIQNNLSVASLASVVQLQVGATAATIQRILAGLGTLSFSVTSANAVQDQNFAIAGAQIRDAVSLGLGTSVPSGAGFMGFIGTLGTVTVRLLNPTAATIGATTLTVRAIAMGSAP